MDEEVRTLLADRPDDLDVRRVFADALLTRGDPRGELMALELELGDPSVQGDRRRVLLERARELRTEPLWFPEAFRVELTNGLPSFVSLSARTLLALGAERTLERMPGVSALEVRLLDTPAERAARELSALFAHPCARGLRRVHLDVGDHDLPALSTFPPLVRALRVSSLLFSHRDWARLAVLELDEVEIATRRLAMPLGELVQTAAAPRLTALGFSNVERPVVTREDIAAIAHAQLTNLESLGLNALRVDVQAALGFSSWRNRAPRLRALDVDDSQFGAWLGASLVGGALLDSLKSLSIARTRAGDETIIALAQSGRPPVLRELAARGAIVTTVGARALLEASCFSNLERLELTRSGLDDAVIAELRARVRDLYLDGKRVGRQ